MTPQPMVEVTGEASSDNLFDTAQFGQRIAAKLKADRMSYREAAAIIPCSHASLNRAARGLSPDVENYLRISRWLTSAVSPEAAEARTRAAEDALRHYGQHDEDCEIQGVQGMKCSCGFSAAISAMED